MSDDDVEVTGTRGSRRNADRRTPRFSWNLAYEETFFRSLCESMSMGYKENHSFKSGAWERAAITLRDKHGAYPEKSHLINKADNARKKFRMWRGLREDPEFLYNPTTRMVTASEEAWQRHFNREPLSKALRGRPFDHEEFMEILFPDVVGSGGAPKRIMKPRRRNPDGTLSARPSTASAAADQSVIHPSLDGSIYAQTPTHNPIQQTQPLSQPIPTPSMSQPMQRPSSTTIPPRSSLNSNPSALTPPDEQVPNTQAQKRPNPNPSPMYPEKRRGRPSRFSTNFYTQQSTTPSSSSAAQHAATPAAPQGSQPVFAPNPGFIEDSILSLAEALKARSPPKWSEQAVEIFFAEFADEDADLQLKIAEKALTDENKAMVFVKMTPILRRHWVGRLREVHMRNLGGGLGLGGRVGEEAS
ncbi:Myb/SANT-like DNA-binding domain-containing protein [Annulohypoxylon maeteangense]|uniref:Myb/SANT-like DNA-binding domain-containing protein n=1 Tax=Annulohypoxylon maeteangense TaxID=1927788 RepID=UPI002007CB7F|nr:Myb/SANT-like DNA-binding domain-containing protein [Annulohypoxylon maeteangense]KAI0880569.1 Myb/SANT-like DNA-binding domain-containing protein [Annulohypoxylon maeteangense]